MDLIVLWIFFILQGLNSVFHYYVFERPSLKWFLMFWERS